MREITVLRADGQVIPRGRIVVDRDGLRTWECRVRESKHLYKRLDAWTVSKVILKQLQDLGVERIRFIVLDQGGEIYEVSLAEFLELAEPLDQSGWKQETEPQYGLARRHWQKRESAVRQLALF
jgi:hypothetical protein